QGNIVEESFNWPLGSKQTTYNQYVMKYIDALADFAPTELIENDFDDQKATGEVSKLEIDGSAVDSYNQANRLVVHARKKFGDNNFFAAWATDAQALTLEEGDRVAAS